jgi:hypothetical protein
MDDALERDAAKRRHPAARTPRPDPGQPIAVGNLLDGWRAEIPSELVAA